ncbi:MAG: thiamine biosynthesis lipoprotein [Myxococcota bacterium]|jgi:thiamine biosynthesis lipoprotein
MNSSPFRLVLAAAFLATAFLGTVSSIGCATVAQPDGETLGGQSIKPKAGLPPQVDGLSIAGKSMAVGAQNLKRPTLFVFWASWCKPCNREAPQLVELSKKMVGRLDIVGVNVDVGLEEAMGFQSKHRLTYPSLHDPGLQLSDAFGVASTPELILVDSTGKELGRGQRLHHLEASMKSLTVSPVTRSEALMGTSIELVVFPPAGRSRADAEAALDAAIAEIARIEQVFSTWIPDSALSKLNQNAGRTTQLPREAITLLAEAKALCTATGGSFDVTFKGAERVWDFGNKAATPPTAHAATPPSAHAAKSAMGLVDCKALHIDEAASTARLERHSMAVGLGGIAKGYAVDKAGQVLEAAGYRDFIVNAGGDLLAKGRNLGDLWRVGIKHPRATDRPLAILPVSGYAIATSGDYERFFEHEGIRYHHILDPKTGQPARGCQSVTILTKRAAMADALATGVFVMGPKAGLELINRLKNTEALIVAADGTVHTSNGLPTASAPHAQVD